MNEVEAPEHQSVAATVELKRREDYRPWPFTVETVELRFELDADCTLVTSRLRISRCPQSSSEAVLNLMGRSLKLRTLRIDNVELAATQYQVDALGLCVTTVPDQFEIEVITELAPRSNHAGKGLFELDGTLVTHMEPEGLSRVTYFPDRPDVLSRYRVTLVADRSRYPVLLSNGNCCGRRDLPDGRHEVIWDDPHPKPSYIFAVVAGDLACLVDRYATGSGREVRIAIYAPERFVARCAFAMGALKRAMHWDEERYGLECDVDDYQVVALAGFPGAQENKGLNLFDLSGIVADPQITTDDEALTIERIIAHEYFHNWTGNRVTCRDWFQLSLKEGLTRFRDQTYIDDLLGAGVYRIDTVRTLLRNQFPEDDGPARHPIRPEVYAEVDQFYTATVYEKGAEVIRMLQTLLGEERFTAGVRDYLRTHDGQAVTTDDFVAAMERSSSRDLTQFRRWYAQAGRPRISASRSYNPSSASLTLNLSQCMPAAEPDSPSAPLHVPIRFSLVQQEGVQNTRSAQKFRDEALLELTQASQSFVFENVAPNTVLSLLEGFSAPVTMEPFLGPEELLLVLAQSTDAYARWNAAQGVFVTTIRALAGAHHAGQELVVPQSLINTFSELLAGSPANRLLTAELLRVPDEPVLSEGLALIDVDGHAVARNAVRAALGRHLKPQLLAAVLEQRDNDRDLMNVAGMGRRRLACVSLDLLVATCDADVAELCLDRVVHGPTMTERFDALSCLVDFDCIQRDQALAAFYERWKDQPTVVSKWFSAQALCRSPGALDRIMALQAHPAFDMNNLTLVMAFFGGFFRQNRFTFHHPSGRGYAWLADLLLMSDRMGRSGGTWLTPQLSQWQRHGPARQELMRCEMQRMLDTPGISNGLRGVIQRLLKG
jgi:aminopeptidase N